MVKACVGIVWACVTGMGAAAKPMERLLSTTKDHRHAQLANLLNGDVTKLLPAARPDAQLQEIMQATKNGVDVMGTFTNMVNSEAFKLITDNADIQSKIIEKMPLLTAFKGFDRAPGLQGNDMISAFKEGMTTALDFVKIAIEKQKNPIGSVDAVVDIAAKNPDLMAAAQAGDKSAFDKITDLFHAQEFPGVNTKILSDVAAKGPKLADLLEMDGLGEIMTAFVDQDPVMSQIVRNPPNVVELVQQYTGQSLFGQ